MQRASSARVGSMQTWDPSLRGTLFAEAIPQADRRTKMALSAQSEIARTERPTAERKEHATYSRRNDRSQTAANARRACCWSTSCALRCAVLYSSQASLSPPGPATKKRNHLPVELLC